MIAKVTDHTSLIILNRVGLEGDDGGGRSGPWAWVAAVCKATLVWPSEIQSFPLACSVLHELVGSILTCLPFRLAACLPRW